jgi:hypothetical protein
VYHSASVPDATVPSFCKQMCNKGLKFLNMKQPVNVIGCIPAAPATPATPATPAAPAAKPAPAAAAASSSKPSPGYTAPTGMENLSPGALSMLQEVMQGFQTGKHKSNPQYLMRQIEEALGDDELRPVLQNVLGNPQVSTPSFRRRTRTSRRLPSPDCAPHESDDDRLGLETWCIVATLFVFLTSVGACR